MNLKDNQMIGSSSHSNSQYVLESRMDINEWVGNSSSHHKSLSARRKSRLEHERKKKFLSTMDE